MPIKNLTDRNTIKPKLPRLGVLRKGAEKPDKGPGEELPFFRFTSDNPEIVKAFYDVYSQEPKAINAVLMHDTVEENFPTWIEAWDASGMLFRSDGEYWHIWRDGNSYKKDLIPHTDAPGQFEVGRLEIIIPELLQQGFVGTVTVLTHSNHDLRHISSVLLAVEKQKGSLSGTQFVVCRVPEKISVPGWGDRSDKRTKATKHLVKLEMPTSIFSVAYQLTDEAENKPLQIEENSSEVSQRHWSENMNNRRFVEDKLAELNIGLDEFFYANKAKNWDDMTKYKKKGLDALRAAQEYVATQEGEIVQDQLFDGLPIENGAYND